jgi:uncharacterized linocin/CFP29 family protein
MANVSQMPCDPQVPWSDEQWARVNQVVQEEASRARVAATFLPLIGPLPGDTDFVRRELISYPAVPAALQPPPNQIVIDDRNIWQLATLQVKVRVRGAQMADSEMTSVLAMFRRAANVVARLEDAVIFTGLAQPGGAGTPIVPTAGAPVTPPPAGAQIWEITGGEVLRGLFDGANAQPGPPPPPPVMPPGALLVVRISQAIGILEGVGHFGPFALVLGNDLFVVAQTPDPGTLVLPQDRIVPFLGGGSLLRSSTLPPNQGVMVALGGAPVELIVATDMCLQFLQLTVEPAFVFRVCEKIALRIKEPSAIVTIL